MGAVRLLAAHLDLTDVENLVHRDIVDRFRAFSPARGRKTLLADYRPTGCLCGAGHDSPGGPFQAGTDGQNRHAADERGRQRFDRKSSRPGGWYRSVLNDRKLRRAERTELVTAGAAEVVARVTGRVTSRATYRFHARQYITLAGLVGCYAGNDFLAHLDVADDIAAVDQRRASCHQPEEPGCLTGYFAQIREPN